MKQEDWIRVEDRLPEVKEIRWTASGGLFGVEKSDDVLVLTDRKRLSVAYFNNKSWCFIDSGRVGQGLIGGRHADEGPINDIEFITHWMPIELPKKEE